MSRSQLATLADLMSEDRSDIAKPVTEYSGPGNSRHSDVGHNLPIDAIRVPGGIGPNPDLQVSPEALRLLPDALQSAYPVQPNRLALVRGVRQAACPAGKCRA